MNLVESNTPAPPARSADQTSSVQWAAALVILAAVCYWPTLNNGYIIDDGEYVQHNALLRTPAGLYSIWFDIDATPQYYPLVFTTFWIEFRLWDVNPLGYHAINMLLHAVCAVLVWRLLAQLAVPGAWLAAAVFAVHPMQVESVAWITERKNVLSCALALGSLLAYLRYAPWIAVANAPGSLDRRPWGAYLLALLLYVGALASKTATVSVPAVLLVICWWKRGRISLRDALPLTPFFALGIAFSVVTVWIESTKVGAFGAEFDLSFVDRLLIAGRAVFFYAGKLIWPYPVVFFYPRWQIDAGAWWQYLFPAAAAALIVALWLARGIIGRGPLAAVLIFCGVLLPTLGFFNVYFFKFSFVANHFAYHASIALIGLLVAAAVLIAERWTAPDSTLRVLAGGGVLLVLAAMTYQLTHTYRDVITLCQATLVHNPSSWAARYNLGDALIAQGKTDEGIKLLQETVRSHPEQHFLRSGLGNALLNAGRTAEAEAEFRRVLESEQFPWARADAYVRLGGLLSATNRTDEAIESFRQALDIDPKNHRAHLSLGLAFAAKGQTDAAIVELRRASEMRPFDPDVQHALGVVLSGQGKRSEAIAHLQMAVDVFRDNAKFREDLGSELLAAGDTEAAQRQFVEAIRVNPRSGTAHNLLGVVMSKRRNYGAAIREFEAALKLDPTLESAKVNLQNARKKKGGL